MTDIATLRAQAAQARAAAGAPRSAVPNGETKRGAPDQRIAFPRPPQFRAEMVEKDGIEWFVVEGYASMTERGYQMWDFFGPYEEIVSRTAFDKTLATKPNVVFRFNHGGTPMANTNDNGRLELWVDALGLANRAYLNPKRADVQELMTAIEDKDVREQSFMFGIPEGGGEWSEDFTQFRINEADLERGDTGPVTYGANPETLIAARSGELLTAIPDLPPWAAREAALLLSERDDVKVSVVPAQDTRDGGSSIKLQLARLELDRQHALND